MVSRGLEESCTTRTASGSSASIYVLVSYQSSMTSSNSTDLVLFSFTLLVTGIVSSLPAILPPPYQPRSPEQHSGIAPTRFGNPFFDHLNRDVRNGIYNYLILPPFEGSADYSGLALPCRQAHLETLEESNRRWRQVLRFLDIGMPLELHEILRPDNNRILRELKPTSHFTDIRNITVRLSSPCEITATKIIDHLLSLQLRSLSIQFRCKIDNPRAMFARYPW
jgi:hypothetical protein